MLIQPREQVLDIWRAVVAYSYRHGEWHWGGRAGSNSISDAEQLLCILYPATNVPELRLDPLDEAAEDVLRALGGLGNDFDLARTLIRITKDYMERYRDSDGTPLFTAGSYLDSEDGHPENVSTPEQDELDIIDSFSMSVTLALATLGFLRVLRGGVRSASTLAQIDELDRLASQRLTAAMVGLLRSFSVDVFEIDSSPGRNLISMINQGHEPERIVAERLGRDLRDIRASLREELSIGSGQVAEQLESPSRLFSCGWSWGVVKDAPEVAEVTGIGRQRRGVAADQPYLYFTGVALAGIADLFSERTRILGLLDDTQQRLAQALQLRWDLCVQYWYRVGTFGSPSRWALEDVPWRTTDGMESDYFTLFVASMVAQRLDRERTSSSPALIRVGRVLEELANRGRITRRPLAHDTSIEVHAPGVRLQLLGSEELGKRRSWVMSNYASVLLLRVVRTASLVPDTVERDRLGDLADTIWRHLLQRRMGAGVGEGLWDQPGAAFELDDEPFAAPSWYHTERVVECLVAAADTFSQPPRQSMALADLAREYLSEAEHIFDQERLAGTPNAGHSIRTSFQMIAARLERARLLLTQRPGTAAVLAQRVLEELDELATARLNQGARDLR